MPFLVQPERVLRARNLSDKLQGNTTIFEDIVESITHVAGEVLNTPLERYTRTDLFDFRPTRAAMCNRSKPVVFRTEQGFIDESQPYVFYEARSALQPIQNVVPKIDSFAVMSGSGTFDDTLVTVSHLGPVTDSWTVTFVSATTFEVSGADTGVIAGGPFDIAVDWAELRGISGEPYFTIPATAWGGTFAVGDTVTLSTLAADTVIANPRAYHVNFEEGQVVLTKWGSHGTRKYAFSYTAGFEDDGECMVNVPGWLESAATTASIRYIMAVASKHNPKGATDQVARAAELARHMSLQLNPHKRERYGVQFAAQSYATLVEGVGA